MNVRYGVQKDRSHWATSAHHAGYAALTGCSRHLAVMRVYRQPKPRQTNLCTLLLHCVLRGARRPKDDQFWSSYTLSRRYRMSTLDEITKEKQRVGEARARRCAAREADEPAQRIGGDRTCARALHQGHSGRKDGRSEDTGDSNKSSRSSATTGASACYGREISWRQAQLVDPGGSGPRPGNRQDAAGNRRRLQGSSPEPRRRRHRSTQAGGPHRRTRWEALRDTVSGDDATWRGLISEDEKVPADPNRKRLVGLSAARCGFVRAANL